MKNNAKHILRTLFPEGLWTVRTTRLWLLTLLTILWFNLEWCAIFSFTTFQIPEMWVNAFLAAFILSVPQMLGRLRRTQAVITTLLAILLECNLMYARTYFNAIPASSYLMAGNLADFTASVIDSIRLLDLGFLILVILTWITACSAKLKPTAPLTLRNRLCWLWPVIALIVASAAMLVRRGGLMKAWEDLSVYKYYSSRVPMYTIAGSVTHDLMTANTPLSPSERLAVEQWFKEKPSLDSIPGAHRNNIILILCESLESWPIGLKLQGKEITPNLNRIIADSTVLYAPNIVSQVGAGRSIDAQLLINAGMLPMNTGIYATDHFANSYNTLNQALEQLREAHSMLLSVDKPHTWNQEAVAKTFGIDSLLANRHWKNTEPVGSKKKLGDRAFARQISEAMQQGKIWPEGSNAFIQIVTYSGHNPFRLNPHLDSLKLNPDGLHPTAHRYLTMTHYTDAAIGQLIDYLKSRPDYRNSLIVITGDHEGLVSERPEINRKNSFVNPQQMVPLIVLNSPVTGKTDRIAGQIDIYPTLLQLAGLTDYHWHGMGQSILDATHPGIAIGSQGETVGDTTNVSGGTLSHLRHARNISNTIIKHNLLDSLRLK